ncbi:unnamed protein product [Spirodela intermedia]|uniref:Uncharacterized protein n=1 Tax=Spirodela intermedia TaxID=51605 RepID=A0A7I8L1M8_SPIIN|nr:unnamed protein product [Spirodela intermedia]
MSNFIVAFSFSGWCNSNGRRNVAAVRDGFRSRSSSSFLFHAGGGNGVTGAQFAAVVSQLRGLGIAGVNHNILIIRIGSLLYTLLAPAIHHTDDGAARLRTRGRVGRGGGSGGFTLV